MLNITLRNIILDNFVFKLIHSINSYCFSAICIENLDLKMIMKVRHKRMICKCIFLHEDI